jgi:hypothetical protein
MDNGKVVMVWKGNNNTFWCLMQYWVGTGFQSCERQITHHQYMSLNAEAI